MTRSTLLLLALILSPRTVLGADPTAAPARPFARTSVLLQADGAQSGKSDPVEELLAAGRAHLAEGRIDEALALFQQAEAQDRASLGTHAFVLRAKIAKGLIEEVLLEVDELARAHPGALELDYLYGTGFHALAEREVLSGQTTAVTGSQFEDAVRHLKVVTSKDEPRFGDAWSTLAASTWYTREFELGRAAAEKAIRIAPLDPWKQLLRGRIALAAFTTWTNEDEKRAAADEEWSAAVAAFEQATTLCGNPPEARHVAAAQQAQMQLGTAQLWKQDQAKASTAWRRAIALDPATADYAGMSASLTGAQLLPILEGAQADWTAAHGAAAAGSAADATLLWWVGYCRYGEKNLAGAEQAFEQALAKNPKFTNCLYYLYRVRFDQRAFAKCFEALHSYQALSEPSDQPDAPPPLDPGGLLNALSFDVPGNTARLEGLIQWSVTEENHPGGVLNLEAAFACELITRMVPREAENSRHWNNLGLFLRDEGDRLRGTQGALGPAPKPFDEALVNRLWERSLAAYETVLELESTNPNYLNDTAVMLHYYFVRDLERAKAMYQKGFEEATAVLKRTDLSPDTRAAVNIALRDTRNNVRLVQKLIDKRAAEASAKTDKPAGG
ncbi:MAG: hypothetical protein IPK67_05185 [Planctomycetes bacterium]|nr:hypothetical protein [Planctomycetota bacterium]